MSVAEGTVNVVPLRPELAPADGTGGINVLFALSVPRGSTCGGAVRTDARPSASSVMEDLSALHALVVPPFVGVPPLSPAFPHVLEVVLSLSHVEPVMLFPSDRGEVTRVVVPPVVIDVVDIVSRGDGAVMVLIDLDVEQASSGRPVVWLASLRVVASSVVVNVLERVGHTTTISVFLRNRNSTHPRFSVHTR